MKEKEELKNKLILHLFYNLIAFSVILLIFGIFVFITVKHIVYKSADEELYESARELKNSEITNNILWPFSIIQNEKFEIKQNLIQYNDYMLAKKIKSPRIIMVLRDEEKNILNENDIGRFSEFINEIEMKEKNFDKIYDIKIGNDYNYRAINCNIDYLGEENRYVQLLINIDSEHELMTNFKYIVFSSVALGILLSIIASFILSKHTLKPLQENLEKQIEFVQNVSHELRTPLAIIQAKQELLLKEPNAKIIDKSEEIILTLNETKRLTKLTKDLMILSSADSKSLNLKKENVNIDDFLENIIKPYREIAELEEKDLITNYQYKNEVNIDTNKIHQLMIIILDNAIKYTELGDFIEVVTYLKDNKCIIEIKDSGIGISDKGLNRVFERFYREDKARNRETGGSGLGLSIANLIVSAHGGTIKASHNKPKGTVFTIKLPK